MVHPQKLLQDYLPTNVKLRDKSPPFFHKFELSEIIWKNVHCDDEWVLSV